MTMIHGLPGGIDVDLHSILDALMPQPSRGMSFQEVIIFCDNHIH